MVYKYEFTELVIKDIDEVMYYITNVLCNENAALELLSVIETTINKVCMFPMSYPNCEYYNIKDEFIRHVIIGNYDLVFMIEKEKIIFLRFKYSKKDKIL